MNIEIADVLKVILRLGNMVDVLEAKLREVAQEKAAIEKDRDELKKLLDAKGGES